MAASRQASRVRRDLRVASRERARTRLRTRSWKIAAFGLLVGPLAAVTQAGPDAAGVTHVNRAIQSMLAIALLVGAGEGVSLAVYYLDRWRTHPQRGA